ncbi:MAG TPA: acyltransferase [bacterium]|nr:acyltransferase [bacterium]
MPNVFERAYQAVIARLSRIQGSAKLVPELESLRFVAIASVFVTHLNGYLLAKSTAAWALDGRGSFWDRLFQQGGYGVQLFFVISGFVLALPFALQHLGRGPAVRPGPYYLRRLTRLEPPYLACLGILFLAQVFYNHQPVAVLLPHLAASALYLHAAIYHKMSTIDPVTWSLEVEIQFYLAAPWLARIFLVRNRARRLALLLAGCLCFQALQAYCGWGDDRDSPNLLHYLPYFLMGFALVDLHLHGDLAPAVTRAWAWDLLIAALAPLTVALAMAAPQWLPLALPWALLALVSAFFRGRWARRALSGTLPVTIGGMCYSIYLFHQTLISSVARFSIRLGFGGAYLPNFLLQAAITGAVVLALTGVFFALVERPCMRRDWPQRLAARLWGRPLPASPSRP